MEFRSRTLEYASTYPSLDWTYISRSSCLRLSSSQLRRERTCSSRGLAEDLARWEPCSPQASVSSSTYFLGRVICRFEITHSSCSSPHWSCCTLRAVPCELFFSLEKWIARTVVGVFGKALSEASCAIIYLYTAELYPTVLRSVKQQHQQQSTLQPRNHRISVHTFCLNMCNALWFYGRNGMIIYLRLSNMCNIWTFWEKTVTSSGCILDCSHILLSLTLSLPVTNSDLRPQTWTHWPPSSLLVYLEREGSGQKQISLSGGAGLSTPGFLRNIATQDVS